MNTDVGNAAETELEIMIHLQQQEMHVVDYVIGACSTWKVFAIADNLICRHIYIFAIHFNAAKYHKWQRHLPDANKTREGMERKSNWLIELQHQSLSHLLPGNPRDCCCSSIGTASVELPEGCRFGSYLRQVDFLSTPMPFHLCDDYGTILQLKHVHNLYIFLSIIICWFH